MAVDLVWLEEAEGDLQAVYEYISAENPRAATAYVEAILSACGQLHQFPLSGRSFNKRYRVLVARNHLVLYRYEEYEGAVIIAAIVDGRRDVDVLLRKLGASEL